MRPYWTGAMNWPLKKDWECVVCGFGPKIAMREELSMSLGLTWGLVHAECRCDRCHTVYYMRDNSREGRPIVDVPISMLKPEYLEAAKRAWKAWAKPLDELTDDEWLEMGVPLPMLEVA